VWFAVAWVLVVSGASVIGPVLLFVADALSDAMFLSVADAEFLSVADADPDGFAVPLPLELGIDVRVADPDAVGETCGAAEEPDDSQYPLYHYFQADMLTFFLSYD
jgi:hypothetical protein